jgi:hypothetical protein
VGHAATGGADPAGEAWMVVRSGQQHRQGEALATWSQLGKGARPLEEDSYINGVDRERAEGSEVGQHGLEDQAEFGWALCKVLGDGHWRDAEVRLAAAAEVAAAGETGPGGHMGL